MMRTRLFLIRHGVTSWNKARRYCGCIDVALSSEGREQAKRLRKRLAGVTFDKLYSSDRKRAMQTARIIFGRKKIIKIKGLREIDFGVLEGLRHKEVLEKYGKVYKAWLKDPFKNNIPKGEPMVDFKKRVLASIKKLGSLNRAKTIAIVCHGGVIGVFVNSLRESRNFWKYVPKAASLTVVEYKKGKAKLRQFNDTAHLE